MTSLKTFGAAALRGAAQSAVTQGIGVLTGLQDKFSWSGVAAAGIGAGVGGAFDNKFGVNPLTGKGADLSFGNLAANTLSGGARAVANAATRSAIDGTNFGDNIVAAIPDVIGQTIGSAIGQTASGSIGTLPNLGPLGRVLGAIGRVLGAIGRVTDDVVGSVVETVGDTVAGAVKSIGKGADFVQSLFASQPQQSAYNSNLSGTFASGDFLKGSFSPQNGFERFRLGPDGEVVLVAGNDHYDHRFRDKLEQNGGELVVDKDVLGVEVGTLGVGDKIEDSKGWLLERLTPENSNLSTKDMMFISSEKIVVGAIDRYANGDISENEFAIYMQYAKDEFKLASSWPETRGGFILKAFTDFGPFIGMKGAKGKPELSISSSTKIKLGTKLRGLANAIQRGYAGVSKRQANILKKLDAPGASVVLKKGDVNLSDLSAMTAETNHEFAMLTNGSRRMVLRGNSDGIKEMTTAWAKDMALKGWRLSGHTHPTVWGKDTRMVLQSSAGDRAVLAAFGQEKSVIVTPLGNTYQIFTPKG